MTPQQFDFHIHLVCDHPGSKWPDLLNSVYQLSIGSPYQLTSGSDTILPRIFDKDVLPALGKRSVYEIKRPDLLEVIAKIEKRRALSVAEKVRTWFNQLFRYALVIVPGLEQNPASDLDVVALPLPPVNHNPFLRMAELPKLLQRLRSYRGRRQTQLGLPLLLLTGVRTGELRQARPDQFDLDRGLWIIPPERALEQLQRIQHHRVRLNGGEPVAGVSTLSTEQNEVLHALGIEKPAAPEQLALL